MNDQTMSAPFDAPIKAILDRVGSRKRKCRVYRMAAGRPVKLRSYWDGGSRESYHAFTKRGKAIDLPVSGAPGFTADPEPWTPAPGDVLVRTGILSGKEATPTITFFE